jgi:DNA helicase HerA-like ATPase
MSKIADRAPIGTVSSDGDTPSFELVRIKLKAGKDVRPNTLVRIPVARKETTTLIARIRSAHETNPNEAAPAIHLRHTMELDATYPKEEESTIIFRVVEADLVEELYEESGMAKTRSPQSLPQSGTDVFLATDEEIVATLGLAAEPDKGLFIGETITGIPTRIILKREAIQRHFFIGGTTGSGKSYAMGVLAEEFRKHDLPIVFLDTQDEYSELTKKLGGQVKVPGVDFNIRVSSLTERELISLIPAVQESDLQQNIVAAAFNELMDELADKTRDRFSIDDLVERIRAVGPTLTKSRDSVELAARRTSFLKRNDIFGEGIGREDWPKAMYPCLSIRCKTLTSGRLQTVATAVLRELQDLRLRKFIPPYVAVIDEAHLFVPEGEGSPCKQIIREGVRIGRHHGICLVLLTQSPVDIEKSVIRQCNTRMIFALEPDQLDAIRGVKSDASEAMLTALPKMPQGTCLLSGTYESVKHSIPVGIRLRETKDSEGGRTPDIFEEMAKKWKGKLKPSK